MIQLSILIPLMLLSFVGCGGKNILLPQEFTKNLNNKTITLVLHEKPSFTAMTPAKGALGIFGALAAITAGNNLIEEYNVQDPSKYISTSIIKDLLKEFQLNYIKNIKNKNVFEDDDGLKNLVKKYNHVDFILDIETLGWGFVYYPLDWDTYKIYYQAQLRLIDIKNKKVIAQSYCDKNPPSNSPSINSPIYDELILNNAKRLKNEIKDSADYCISYFNSSAFAL